MGSGNMGDHPSNPLPNRKMPIIIYNSPKTNALNLSLQSADDADSYRHMLAHARKIEHALNLCQLESKAAAGALTRAISALNYRARKVPDDLNYHTDDGLGEVLRAGAANDQKAASEITVYLSQNVQGQPPASETTPTNQTFPVAATRNDPPTWRPFLSKNGTSDPLDRHPASPRRNCFECGCCRAWNHHPDCWTGRLEKFIANAELSDSRPL